MGVHVEDIDRRTKARGAFFTPPQIAHYLASWAIRDAGDSILEPSCGEASFLLAAGRRLKALGGLQHSLPHQLHGVEIHEQSAHTAKLRLSAEGLNAEIAVRDFFEFDTSARYRAIIGNPPFVRYQDFSGLDRARSLEAALAQGVRLSGLASSWAAFVVQAARHLAEDGRLALVLPAELLSVGYAREIRTFLLRRFASVRLVIFEERVFPGVLEEVVLLLAEGTGGAHRFEVYQTKNADTLPDVHATGWIPHTPRDGAKWTAALLAEDAFGKYEALREASFEQLDDWGSTYLGAVTGNNRYFALNAAEAREAGLSERDLIRISPPGSRHLRGLTFTDAAWKALAKEGARSFMFYPAGELAGTAERYAKLGEEAGVAKAYKCRVRTPWWRVPLVHVPDLFLTYMNHERPRLITNATEAHILNSVYGVRLREGRKKLGRDLLPLSCLNSVTLLGAEVVGRAYGGGLLKLEPREADKLPVPSLDSIRKKETELRSVRPQLAATLRNGSVDLAAQIVDRVLLPHVPNDDLSALRVARDMLFHRRRARAKNV